MNVAYVAVTGFDLGNSSLGSEPAGIEISYIILTPSNSVVAHSSGGVYANFEYGASWEDIRASIIAQLRSNNSDPDLSVVFLPAG